MPDTDDYAQATGHEITCTAGFNDECSCGTAPTRPTGPVSNASYPREGEK